MRHSFPLMMSHPHSLLERMFFDLSTASVAKQKVDTVVGILQFCLESNAKMACSSGFGTCHSLRKNNSNPQTENRLNFRSRQWCVIMEHIKIFKSRNTTLENHVAVLLLCHECSKSQFLVHEFSWSNWCRCKFSKANRKFTSHASCCQ